MATKKQEERNERFDYFLNFRKRNLDIGHTERVAHDGSAEEKAKALKELRGLAYKFAKEETPVLVSGRTEEQFNDPSEIQAYLEQIKSLNMGDYSNLFAKDQVKLTTAAIPNGTLENMINSEDPRNPFLMSATDEKGHLVYLTYHNIADVKEKAKRFEQGVFKDSDEREEYLEMAAAGAVKEQSDRIRAKNKKNKGDYKATIISEDVIQALGSLAGRAVKSGLAPHDALKKYVVSGAKVQVEQANKQYESAVAKKGTDIYGVVREGIEKLSKDVETRVQVMDRLYQAHQYKARK